MEYLIDTARVTLSLSKGDLEWLGYCHPIAVPFLEANSTVKALREPGAPTLHPSLVVPLVLHWGFLNPFPVAGDRTGHSQSWRGLQGSDARALPRMFCTHTCAGEAHTGFAPRHNAGTPCLRAPSGSMLHPLPASDARGDEHWLCHILAMTFMKPHTSISCCLELPQPFLTPSEL